MWLQLIIRIFAKDSLLSDFSWGMILLIILRRVFWLILISTPALCSLIIELLLSIWYCCFNIILLILMISIVELSIISSWKIRISYFALIQQVQQLVNLQLHVIVHVKVRPDCEGGMSLLTKSRICFDILGYHFIVSNSLRKIILVAVGTPALFFLKMIVNFLFNRRRLWKILSLLIL